MSNANSSTKTASAGGTGFLGFLTLMFIAFKLLGISAVATWSWLWVLSPLWIPLAVILVLAAIGGIIFLIYSAFAK